MKQIALPLDISPSSEEGGYLIAHCNADAHAQLENWALWPHKTAILIGPKSAGKTAMAKQFIKETGGLILDDADQEAAETIFHLWNRAATDQKPLLLTATQPVIKWNIALADLRSRLAASLLITLGPPDETMIEGLFQQYFAKRSLSISEETIQFLSKRIERSYENIELLAHKMNIIALERKKPITLAVAKAALSEHVGNTESEDGIDEIRFYNGKG